MLHATSDQGRHCLLTAFSTKNRIKVKRIRPDTAKMTNGLVQHVTVEESTGKPYGLTEQILSFKGRLQFRRELKTKVAVFSPA